MLKLISHHFIFRINQGFRIFNLNTKVSLPILLILGLLISVKLPAAHYYPLVFFAMSVMFHFNRKDIPFLKKVFVRSWRMILYLESALIYGFFLVSNIHYKMECLGWSIFLVLILFSFYYPKNRVRVDIKWNFVTNALFEWRSFLRKHTWIFILCYGLVILSAYHASSLILFGLLISGYFQNIFEHNESKEMLEMYFKTYSFDDKIKLNIRFFNYLLLPTYLLFLVLNYEYSLYLIYYFLFMNTYFLLVLTRKYKMYHHKNFHYLDMGTSLVYFLYCITIVPAWFVIYQNRKLAKQNISTYVGS